MELFVKVLANNVTIRDVTPYVALHGDLGKHLRFYAGLRHDQIQIDKHRQDEARRFLQPMERDLRTPRPR